MIQMSSTIDLIYKTTPPLRMFAIQPKEKTLSDGMNDCLSLYKSGVKDINKLMKLTDLSQSGTYTILRKLRKLDLIKEDE